MTSSRRSLRIRVLESCGAAPSLIDELLAYGEQPCRTDGRPQPACPLPDEAQVDAWERYAREALADGAATTLARHLVQLRFPVRAGMSDDAAYRNATRKGLLEAAVPFAPGIVWRRPDQIRLEVAPTMAGRLPIIVAGDRQDFEWLVQALSARNEPVPVPAAMGACLVKGLNNWSRVADHRAAWEREHPGADWAEGFAELIPQKALYQDRLIILSAGPYSATAASDTGLEPGEWLARSLTIRREHELTHYFVYRVCGVMRSHAFDEIVADFIGLSRAFGAYRPDLALRFLGLEAFPAYRPDGRLEVYRSDPPLSEGAAAVVRALAHRAVGALAVLAASWPRERWSDLAAVGRLTFALHQLTFEELASDELPDLVGEIPRA
jgi:hypothetical protein